MFKIIRCQSKISAAKQFCDFPRKAWRYFNCRR